MRMGHNDRDSCIHGSCSTLKMESTVFILVYFLQNLDIIYDLLLSLSAQIDYVLKSWKKKLLGCSALCIKIFSDAITFLITMLIF